MTPGYDPHGFSEDVVRNNTSLHEFRRPGHSYRYYLPSDLVELYHNTDEANAIAGFEFIESGRFAPLIRAADEFLTALYDRDMEYAREWVARNPDIAQFVFAFRHITDQHQLRHLPHVADKHLTSDRYSVQNAPAYTDQLPGTRYEQQNPHQLREQHADPADKPDLRAHLKRVERSSGDHELSGPGGFLRAGRFDQLLEASHKHFVPLDTDEKRSFARRNPGLTQYTSLWGWSQDLTYGEHMMTPWPAFPDIGFGETYTPPRDWGQD